MTRLLLLVLDMERLALMFMLLLCLRRHLSAWRRLRPAARPLLGRGRGGGRPPYVRSVRPLPDAAARLGTREMGRHGAAAAD